jgi:hypothetical protein
MLRWLEQRYAARVGVEYRQREPGAIVIDFSVRRASPAMPSIQGLRDPAWPVR